MEYFAKEYDVAVIGAGHAGIEAGLASARLGSKTIVFTINLDWIGNFQFFPNGFSVSIVQCDGKSCRNFCIYFSKSGCHFLNLML